MREEEAKCPHKLTVTDFFSSWYNRSGSFINIFGSRFKTNTAKGKAQVRAKPWAVGSSLGGAQHPPDQHSSGVIWGQAETASLLPSRLSPAGRKLA